MTVDAASLLCCCAAEGVPQNCDDWLACAADTMTITAYGVRRQTRYVSGSPDSPFVEEEQTFSYSATLLKVPGQYYLEGVVSGTVSARYEAPSSYPFCPGHPYCPGCGSCCSAIRRMVGISYSGTCTGIARVGCTGSAAPLFPGPINTNATVGAFGEYTSCANIPGVCPQEPCEWFAFPPAFTGGLQPLTIWAGCASSSTGQAEWMARHSYSTTETYQMPAWGDNGELVYCFDPYAVTSENPLGIICHCAPGPFYCGSDPLPFPCSPMHCPQYGVFHQEEVYVIS